MSKLGVGSLATRRNERATRISLPALTQDAAERAVAELWYRLEQHGLATPKLGVRASDTHMLKLSLEFEDAQMGVVAIHDWAEELGRRLATTMPHLRLLLDDRPASCNRASDPINAP
jgi:hypothetical protein